MFIHLIISSQAQCFLWIFSSFSTQISLFLSFLHTRLRTATLRHDADGQAVLLNLLLRNYLHFNLYDQAEKLVSKSVFPELANNNEWARYLYYTGGTLSVSHSGQLCMSRVDLCVL